MKDADGLQRGVSINLYAPLKQGQKWYLSVTGEAGKYIACCDYGELDNGLNATTMAATACGKSPYRWELMCRGKSLPIYRVRNEPPIGPWARGIPFPVRDPHLMDGTSPMCSHRVHTLFRRSIIMRHLTM